MGGIGALVAEAALPREELEVSRFGLRVLLPCGTAGMRLGESLFYLELKASYLMLEWSLPAVAGGLRPSDQSRAWEGVPLILRAKGVRNVHLNE